MHCWFSYEVSLDDDSLVELWLRNLTAMFGAGKKITCFSFITTIKLKVTQKQMGGVQDIVTEGN
jgi:hypothetical protein